MSVGKLVYLYRGWIRDKPAREAFAALGVAVGVALVFATVTANRSIGVTAGAIMRSLTGSAQLHASALDPEGAPQSSIGVTHLAGVKHAAVALRAPLTISSGGRSVATQILGVEQRIVTLNRSIAGLRPSGGLMLPAALAGELHVRVGEQVTVSARGKATRVPVEQVLGVESVGVLAHSLVAFGLLPYVQRILGMPGRVSTVLVSALPGELGRARASLRESLGRGWTVGPALSDEALLRQALSPQDQSTSFFALLGVLVGLLLAGAATMLTIADRRRELEMLRLQGYTRPQLVQIVLFQGVVLGAVASLGGVVAGYFLAVGAFKGSPDYLASAFPLGSETSVSVLFAVGVWVGGAAVTCACIAPALSGARSFGAVSRSSRAWMAAVAAVLVAVAMMSRSLLAAPLLAAAVILCVPLGMAGVVWLADRATGRWGWLVLAVGSLRATPMRSSVLAATAAIGVFGATVAQGALHDLLSGLESGYAHYVDSADIWVSSPSDHLATSPLRPDLQARIASVHGVSVRPYFGGWVDVGSRRVWLISHDAGVPSGQIVDGVEPVEGSIAVSDQLAKAEHVGIGGRMVIPTPNGPVSLRVSATTTNLGWSSGVLFLPAADYKRYWGGAPTAFEVQGPASAIPGIRRVVGPGVEVQTAAARAAAADALPRQGLERQSEIAWLLVIAAACAVALAIGASTWQRRGEFASLRMQSLTSGRIQAVLACESALITGAGVILGGAVGVCGHFAADAYLRSSTAYPIVWGLGAGVTGAVMLLVLLVTTLILAVPGYIAARAPLNMALEGS